MKSFLWKHLVIHIKIDEPYRKKAIQSSNKSEAPDQKMRIVALILVLFLLKAIRENDKIEENISRGQEVEARCTLRFLFITLTVEENPATVKLYLKIAIAFELYILLLLKSGLIRLLLHPTMHCCFWCCCCWINRSQDRFLENLRNFSASHRWYRTNRKFLHHSRIKIWANHWCIFENYVSVPTLR